MPTVRPIERPDVLDPFVRRQPLSPFLQSWAWGEFQRRIGRRIWRLGAWEGSELVGSALLVEHQLLLAQSYLYCPHGPLAAGPDAARMMFEAITSLGRRMKAMYVKIDPPQYGWPFDAREILPDSSTGTTLQPRHTQVVDVRVPAGALLEQMHPKTRYNIRLAEKKGVSFRWSTTDEDFERFMALQHDTARRQGIRLHPDPYYRTMFEVLRANQMTQLAIGEYNGQAETINQVVWYGPTATFLHGGARHERKDLMASYLVQWRTIEEAVRRGMNDYDFRGIAPEGEADHKLAGVTRFKKGFGGRTVEYPSAVNVILQPQWYWAYRYAKRIRGGRDE